jgi:hypothetical protein
MFPLGLHCLSKDYFVECKGCAVLSTPDGWSSLCLLRFGESQ